MHLMYKIADARSLSSARVGLASGAGASTSPSPPPLVLDLWTDVVSHSIAVLADTAVKGKYSSRAEIAAPATPGASLSPHTLTQADPSPILCLYQCDLLP